MAREPAHFAVDRGVVDVVEDEAAADALEQVADGGRGGAAPPDAADQRRAGLGLRVERLDRFFDLLGAGNADLGFVELGDRRIELDRFDEGPPRPARARLRERSRAWLQPAVMRAAAARIAYSPARVLHASTIDPSNRIGSDSLNPTSCAVPPVPAQARKPSFHWRMTAKTSVVFCNLRPALASAACFTVCWSHRRNGFTFLSRLMLDGSVASSRARFRLHSSR